MTAPGTPTTDGREWTAHAAETVEAVVLTVKEKTTVPAQTAARVVVYGLVIAVLGVIAMIVMIAALVRMADVYLLGWAGRVHGQHRLWIAYLSVGLILTLAGLIFWRIGSKEKKA